MRGTKRVVRALVTLGEAVEATGTAQRAHPIPPSGQDLVRVALIADIPDQPVAWCVEDVVQRQGQLDHAEPGTEMPARARDRIDQLGAQFGGDLGQAFPGQAAQGFDGRRPIE